MQVTNYFRIGKQILRSLVTVGGMDTRPNTRDSLAANLRLLMDMAHLDQPKLAKLSGVSQKTISNMVNRRTAPTLDKVEAVANAFGLTAWHLILPDLPKELVSGGRIEQMVSRYLHANPAERDYVDLILSRTSHDN